MPVRSEEITPGMLLFDSFSNPVTEPLLPDDIWHKFELDFLQLPGISEVLNVTPPPENHSLENTSMESTPLPRLKEVWAGNHDCMWAGHCGSTEHTNDEFRHPGRLIPTPGTSLMRPPPVPVIKQENRLTQTQQQQSLLKPKLRAAMLQTPPMSDEEDVKGSKPINVLMLLRDAIADCELDGEIDLCNYLEDRGEEDVSMYTIKEEPENEEEDTEEEDDVEEEEEDDEEEDEDVEVIVDAKPGVSNAHIKSYQTAAESDHSYHKGGQSSSAHLAEFGIDTPSDSEEEIDVVSVVDKMQFQNNKVFLPTNPSNTDRQHIQRRMATAISRRNAATAGIKTILPQRKTGEKTTGTAASRRKAAETPTRGVKRARQNRNAQSTPYKRRSYGPSSDSEPEPSEKRSLHNNMERQRRIDLRNAFEDLRVLVPEVSKKERAAKVVILREATQYCNNLFAISKNYSTKMTDLNRKQEKLRCMVAQLRVELAAKHLAAKR